MLGGSRRPMIQVDRLTFDTRNQLKQGSIIPDVSPSSTIFNFLTDSSNKKDISAESYVLFPSNKIKIIRLTLEDLNNEQKMHSIDQRSLPNLENKIKQKDEYILSPVYESIDGRQDNTQSILLENRRKPMMSDTKYFIDC